MRGDIAFDARDGELLLARMAARERIAGPRIGDFVQVDGTLRRCTHDWGDAMQVTPEGHGGSFFLYRSGEADYSGSLDPGIPLDQFEDTGENRPGRFWFFHHDETGAHRGVNCEAPCRVYRLRGAS